MLFVYPDVRDVYNLLAVKQYQTHIKQVKAMKYHCLVFLGGSFILFVITDYVTSMKFKDKMGFSVKERYL